tara:strand:+ start:2595 stop:2789 length:195 start_codon:yes stop_codon:yes gene_type:complete
MLNFLKKKIAKPKEIEGSLKSSPYESVWLNSKNSFTILVVERFCRFSSSKRLFTQRPALFKISA